MKSEVEMGRMVEVRIGQIKSDYPELLESFRGVCRSCSGRKTNSREFTFRPGVRKGCVRNAEVSR